MKNQVTKKPKNIIRRSSFSTGQIIIFVIAFAIIGVILYRSFAAGPVVASLEGEQMNQPAGAAIVNDSTASGGQALLLAQNGSAGGTFNLSSSANSMGVVAKGVTCQGSPTMNVSVDGAVVLSKTSVSSTSWTTYTATVNLTAGNHNLSVSFTNDNNYSKRKGHTTTTCSRDLYVDVSNFYGSTPPPPSPPTVSINASPSSVNAGNASTLTWSSTNANSCSASGAWSGSEPTSGSSSTGAINQTSTYTLACTGTGGSSSSSTTVIVSSSGPPSAPTIYFKPLSQAYAVGSNFTVEVRENSGSTPVNVIQANFTYPSNLLTYVSADASASAFSVDAQNTIAGGSAAIARGTCGGCAPATGDQLLETLTFQAAAAGTAKLTFSTGSLMVTSDTNQNILNIANTGGGTFTLQ